MISVNKVRVEVVDQENEANERAKITKERFVIFNLELVDGQDMIILQTTETRSE